MPLRSNGLPGRFLKPYATSIPMVAYIVFTVVALAGYATFGRYPQLLSRFPDLLPVYAVAFTFFAQVHVWLSGLVLFVYLYRHTGFRWIPAFALLYLISFTSEYVGTGYGIPFGTYGYSDMLGLKWFDRVPLVIPLSWFAMAIPSYTLALYILPEYRQRWIRLGFATLLLASWDLSLDPAMSYLTSYWWWGSGGPYYGMPYLNLFGWIATGAVLMGVLQWTQSERWIRSLSPRWMALFYAVTLAMPLGMVVAAGLWLAALLTLVLLGLAAVPVYRKLRRSGADNENKPPVQPVEASSSGRRPHQRSIPEEHEQPHYLAGAVAERVFRQHATSFSFAARWFPPRERRMIACLYAFCRTTDDMVDRQDRYSLTEIHKQLSDWVELARRAYAGEPSGIDWLDEIMQETAAVGMPFRIVEELADGVRMDVGPLALQTVAQLDAYSYKVASVVGIWMCYLYGIKDPDVLDRAAALGRAMQWTNVLRDVGEDLAQQRIYLPETEMRRYGVTVDDLFAQSTGQPPTQGYQALIEDLIRRAEADYAWAHEGLVYLPPHFGRAAAVAAELYRGIHRSIRQNGYDNVNHRAYTSLLTKVLLSVRALWRLNRLRRQSVAPRPVPAVDRGGFGHWMTAGLTITLLVSFALHLLGAPIVPPVEKTSFVLVDSVRDRTAVNPSYDRLRMLYLEAVENEAAIDTAETVIQRVSRRDDVVEAYAAAFTILRAKHAFWPVRKMRYLNRGLPILDRLVQKQPEHVEIRYLRLLSCYYLPGFLGRSWSVKDDFKALTGLLPGVHADYPPALFQDMVRFVVQRGSLTEEKRQQLAGLIGESRTALSKRDLIER